MEPLTYEDCLMTDLLWADPFRNCDKETDFGYNDKWSISSFFGRGPVNNLLEKDNLKAVIRGNEVKQFGFKKHHWNGKDKFPPVITVFSAPNYCGTHEN